MRKKAETMVMSLALGLGQVPRLDGVAARRRMSRSRLVREFIEACLAAYEVDPRVPGRAEEEATSQAS